MLTQRGVGLIEVLIAVLILSVGLLGIAMVQVRALSSNNSSMTRSAAIVASYSALDVLRTQRADALSLDVTLSTSDCDADSGTAYIVAQLKVWCQNELSADRLGDNAQGKIKCDAVGACTVTITFHSLDCGDSGDGQSSDGLCAQTVGTGAGAQRAQQIVTQALL